MTMKKSISYWSFDGGLEGRKDIGECFEEARQAGYDAVELALGAEGVLTTAATETQCRAILDKAARAGVSVSSLASGLYWDFPLSDGDPRIAKQAMEIARRQIEIASWLEVDTVLVIPGAVDVFFKPDFQHLPYDVVYERARQAVEELTPVAEACRVHIGLENVWNKFLLSPLEMQDFVDGFGSDYVGVYFDVGNVLLLGYPEDWIRILAHRIKKVHLKDFKTSVGTVDGFCDLTEGDVDWTAVMAALTEVGYDSYLTAEMVPPTPGIVQKTSLAMDRILGG